MGEFYYVGKSHCLLFIKTMVKQIHVIQVSICGT